MVVPFRKLSTKKEAILTSKIDQLTITIGISIQKMKPLKKVAIATLLIR